MLVSKDKLPDIYTEIRHRNMLQADNIAHCQVAVRGIDDIVEKVDEVDLDSCHTLILLNCGASEDLMAQLRLEERPDLQVVVIDSHRPFSLMNVYSDTIITVNIEGEEVDEELPEGDIERARILLVHDPILDAEGIPDSDTMRAALAPGEEDEEEDEEDFGESPVQRRRVGEDGESVAMAGGEEDEREERRRRREERDKASAIVEEYYSGTSRGPATAMLMMELSNSRVNRLEPAVLWWAVLGVTEQQLNDDIDDFLYDKVVQTLIDENITVNAKTVHELGGSKIVHVEEFRFFLLEHWNLYEAMQHSTYIASKLEIWKDRTSTKLDTLLAKMGIPLEQAKQKYMHMKEDMKDRLKMKLQEDDLLRREFHLDKISFPTFIKERKTGINISAMQCTVICNAMLCLQPSEDEQWTDAFDRAKDAIWMSANREQAWDELLNRKGPHNVVEGAIRLQRTIMRKAFEICQDKAMQKFTSAGFTASRILAGRDNQILLHPSALAKLAMYVLDLDRKKYEDRKKQSGGAKPVLLAHSRWVLGVENEEDTSCLVVGVHASSELGYKEKNKFGKLFKDAIEDGVDGCEIEACVQGFETNVLRITSGKFDTFIDWLATQLTS